jgi:hypothetical protein
MMNAELESARKHTRIASFLLFRPLSRLPFGSLDSDVRGWPFLRGSLTRKIENAAFPTIHITESRNPAKQHFVATQKLNGNAVGSIFVLGRLKNGRRKSSVVRHTNSLMTTG